MLPGSAGMFVRKLVPASGKVLGKVPTGLTKQGFCGIIPFTTDQCKGCDGEE
jgi:hypothetical protein